MRIISLSSITLILLIACNNTTNTSNNKTEGTSKENSSTIGLFDRWEKVWRDGQYDLIPSCVADKYIRHDSKGDRIVTREEYENEIKETRKLLPDVRFIVYDNSFSKDQAWLRYTMTYTSPETNELTTAKGIQVYRIEEGKLAETWMVMLEAGTSWADSSARKCWSCSQ
ncbi:MAG TPA: nuclear transport factor 2 family protein [Chitinophagaceae bacterium]|nr:nuclear transport factor 2 family protein [Chitinophagaceae bacterium]MCB9056608.1 nuclear transport factor 2 family protein [Chitinophagales bacterium]HPG11950.1 nuclear transport factor 2 family protein [Chitinophagaceae bacterium]